MSLQSCPQYRNGSEVMEQTDRQTDRSYFDFSAFCLLSLSVGLLTLISFPPTVAAHKQRGEESTGRGRDSCGEGEKKRENECNQ